jgi:hypothetical protein
MDKIAFLNELTAISGNSDTDKLNFDMAMSFDVIVNLYYEALCIISDIYQIHGNILVSPLDFKVLANTPAAGPGFEFHFQLSDLVKKPLDISKPIQLSQGLCELSMNSLEAGYTANIIPASVSL